MRILLTNDDGIRASGIAVLAKRLARNHTVFIAAPDAERSGAAHSFTFLVPLRAEKFTMPQLPGAEAYAVSGTPVDCVKLALGNLFTDIDIVISGINLGANLGSDVRYSGTVSAAMEAALLGYKAFAVSITEYKEPKNLATAAAVTDILINEFSLGKLEFGAALNINVPDLPLSELGGIRATGLSRQEYAREYASGVDPHGRAFYWTPYERTTKCAPDEDSDERWIRNGYAALTPLEIDMAAEAELKKMRGVRFCVPEADDE